VGPKCSPALFTLMGGKKGSIVDNKRFFDSKEKAWSVACKYLSSSKNR
jgi:hypothetical protein